MTKYTVVFTHIYEVEADSDTQALDLAEEQGRYIDGECFVEEAYASSRGDA